MKTVIGLWWARWWALVSTPPQKRDVMVRSLSRTQPRLEGTEAARPGLATGAERPPPLTLPLNSFLFFFFIYGFLNSPITNTTKGARHRTSKHCLYIATGRFQLPLTMPRMMMQDQTLFLMPEASIKRWSLLVRAACFSFLPSYYHSGKCLMVQFRAFPPCLFAHTSLHGTMGLSVSSSYRRKRRHHVATRRMSL